MSIMTMMTLPFVHIVVHGSPNPILHWFLTGSSRSQHAIWYARIEFFYRVIAHNFVFDGTLSHRVERSYSQHRCEDILTVGHCYFIYIQLQNYDF